MFSVEKRLLVKTKQKNNHNVSKNAERSGESSRSPLCVSVCSPDASDYPRPRASSGRSPDSTCGATRRSLAADLLSFISNRKRKSSHDESSPNRFEKTLFTLFFSLKAQVFSVAAQLTVCLKLMLAPSVALSQPKPKHPDTVARGSAVNQ